MRDFIMRFYGVDAAQAAAREPAAWFVLIVVIAALLMWGWGSISYTMKLEDEIITLEERVRRYRLERDILEFQLSNERASKERAR